VTDFLFVYGTLQSSFRNKFARLLRQQAKLLGPATIRGRLFGLRRYPGLRPALEPNQWVTGELFRLRQPARTLPVLDAYEDIQFRRVRRRVYLSDGQEIRCWVYLYNKALPPHRLIPSGEWHSRRYSEP
jgi:gamma-glutamylcyclotransferase (GGCT)/AIG2-like uncharacterized protein YtfP